MRVVNFGIDLMRQVVIPYRQVKEGNPTRLWDETGKENKMHKMSGWMVGAFAAFMAVGAAADESAFTWPESGDATIPKGVTVVVTDSDYDRVNALTSITISDGATNIFQTSKAPTTQILGSGAWVKRGDAYWTLSVEQRNFYGSMIIERVLSQMRQHTVKAGHGVTITINALLPLKKARCSSIRRAMKACHSVRIGFTLRDLV